MPATVEIKVTIVRVLATNNFDGDFWFDTADFYPEVRIDDLWQPMEPREYVISNDNDITPKLGIRS